MEKYVVPISPSQNPNTKSRPRWKRIVSELDGRISAKNRHEDSQLLLDSYSEGVYMASVTRSGCLAVHDFETLYCSTYGPSSSSLEDETKHLLHISTSQTLDAVWWNPTNQDEVACSSRQINNIFLYDIGYMSSELAEVVFGASKQGIIYAWDLRGGRSSLAFQSLNEVYYPPLISLKASKMLEKISSLKAQSNIMPREIHSISFDPSCSYQLAFHLDDSWSGILNVDSLNVTHMHCPPPAWLYDMEISSVSSSLRKPAWLPGCSIYAVGSSSGKGVYLLDFFPDKCSACYVDFNEDLQSISDKSKESARNKFCTVSECVLICAAHPINGTIIAGTKHSSLMVISQRHQAYMDVDSMT